MPRQIISQQQTIKRFEKMYQNGDNRAASNAGIRWVQLVESRLEWVYCYVDNSEGKVHFWKGRTFISETQVT